jgi:hypothetical protein
MLSTASLSALGYAMIYAGVSGQVSSDVLLSGEESLPPLVRSAGTYTAGTLVLLIVCKSLAYLAPSKFLWRTVLQQTKNRGGFDGHLENPIREVIRSLVRPLDDETIKSLWRETEAGMCNDNRCLTSLRAGRWIGR